MRTPAALLLGAALGALAPPAFAEEAPAKAATASEPPTHGPPSEPPYNPAEHDGVPYATYIRATRGLVLQSPGMMVTGILLVAAGNVLMGVGTGVYAAAGGCASSGPVPPDAIGSSCPDGGPPRPPGPGHTSGMAILVAGTLMTGLGIPLWVLGESPVRRAEAASAPTLRVGLGTAAITWTF